MPGPILPYGSAHFAGGVALSGPKTWADINAIKDLLDGPNLDNTNLASKYIHYPIVLTRYVTAHDLSISDLEFGRFYLDPSILPGSYGSVRRINIQWDTRNGGVNPGAISSLQLQRFDTGTATWINIDGNSIGVGSVPNTVLLFGSVTTLVPGVQYRVIIPTTGAAQGTITNVSVTLDIRAILMTA